MDFIKPPSVNPITNPLSTVTINRLKTDYQNYLQAQATNSNSLTINAFAPNSFWDIDSGAMGAILLDLYMNLNLLNNSIYPQFSSGEIVDQWLYSLGLPSRRNPTYAVATCTLFSPTSPVLIPINTIFTDATTNNQFQTLAAINVTTNNNQQVSLYALQIGGGILENIGTTLTATISSVDVTLTVVLFSTGNSNSESDQSCITRILAARASPQAGSRQIDYFNYAFQSDNTITWVITIPSFNTINGVTFLGIFPLTGSLYTDYELNQGLLGSSAFLFYTRPASSALLQNVDNNISYQHLIGTQPKVYPNNTYIIPSFEVRVALTGGQRLDNEVSINTILSIDSNGVPVYGLATFTILQLVQREVRRVLVNQPYGATLIGVTNRYITADNIITGVMSQLGVNSGQIAQILINIQVNNGDIAVPKANDFVDQIKFTYDVSAYASIDVQSQTS